MIEAGIDNGDILIVDRSIDPAHNAIVVARVGTELTVKRLSLKPEPHLAPANSNYPSITFSGNDIEILGVVTFTIKRQWPL